MTSFLVFIILVLVGIAVWQLTKIFDLTQIGGSSANDEIANDKDNSVNGYLMFAFVGFIYVFTIYSLYAWGELVLGTPGSEHGTEVDNLMAISMALIFFVQTITQFLLHYFAFKYRGKEGQKALYFADNNKLEAIWTIIPVIVLAGLIMYGLYTWNDIMFVDKEDEQDAIVIELYAKQFGWEARYAGDDKTLGKANVRLIEGINTLGVDLADPAAQDDKVVTELHLPVGKRVIFKMRSQDVLHSAYMPHFRAQMNCVPGMITQFSFIPTVTTADMRNDEAIIAKVDKINKIRTKNSKKIVADGGVALDPYTFDYLLLCNKICGKAHYNMQMKIVVDTPADFKAWLAEKPTLAQQWKEANAPAPAEVPVVTPVVAIDSTKVVAQVIK
ncbi:MULTISPECIES: cytochrome c oxidase subunit II [unclassified Flavobacterium]|uniref:cytochrome c oxidase subunit II n=1 Tax=unclassified Flavobacterium TaxID=196869 RepID=UPI0012921112|nr:MULTISPECIES: cytochrome c oxidase subunit II [unclassified Flavobacterium]MQP51724.1 cytochrome c oxidase subunit II [Flavobacterium sp. LMO9]MQP61594.1 cytochrome c oxidase subunit II [Flavobacterium sp. LMO6]